MTSASKSPLERVAPLVRDLPRSGIRDFFDIVAYNSHFAHTDLFVDAVLLFFVFTFH